MVKQSLLNYLTNELPEIPKEKLKSLIFPPPDERNILDGIDDSVDLVLFFENFQNSDIVT